VCSRFKSASFYFEAILEGVPSDLGPCLVLYYLAFPRDPLYARTLVYFLYILEFAQTVLVVVEVYGMFTKNFMDPYVFDRVGILWPVPPLTAIGASSLNCYHMCTQWCSPRPLAATLLAQCYYAFRIKTVTGSVKIPIIIVVVSSAIRRRSIAISHYGIQLSICQLGGSIGVASQARYYKFYSLLNTPEMSLGAGLTTGVCLPC